MATSRMALSTKSISSLSNSEKLAAVFQRVGKYIGSDARQLLEQLISPSSLEIMAATMVVWGIAQLFGVGEVVDIIMLALGAAVLGKNAIDFITDLVHACTKTLHAGSDDDLEEAAQYLGKAIVEGGVEVILALLLRKDLGEIKIKLNNLRTMKPGLIRLGPPPPANGKLKISFARSLGSGANKGLVRGETDAFGKITIAREGFAEVGGRTTSKWGKFSADEKMDTILHEMVHRYLSPRLGPLREFRASVGITGYSRLYLLRYLEEALAQGYSQVRTRGLSGVWAGLRFPIKNGYVTVLDFTASMRNAGAILIDTVCIAGRQAKIYFLPGNPPPKAAPTYEWLETKSRR